MTDRIPFWRRQLTGEPTALQYTFDLLFGAILPIICMAADPIVFGGALSPRGSFTAYAPFAYVMIGVQILALLAWFLAGSRFGVAGPWFAGMLSAGGLFAGVLGVALLPLSLVGLMLIIGVLGFTPLLTSFVFLRNALRAYAKSTLQMRPAVNFLLLAAGLLSGLMPAVAADRYTHHSIEALLEHPEKPDPLAEAFVPPRRIVEAFIASPTGPRREALASLHHRLTGREIQVAVERLND